MKIKSLLITAVLAITILCSTTVVSAATLTSAQISAIINMLQVFGADTTTIANVQTSLNGGIPNISQTNWCHTFNNDIKLRDNSNEVLELENALERNGINIPYFPNNEAKKYFNAATSTNVKEFQKKYGILQTGYVGPLTRAKLNSLYGCRITCPQYSPPPPGWCNGTILPPVMDSNGCYGPSRCSTNGGITITSVSGPNSLAVGQTGTWTVNATAPAGSNLTYQVIWDQTPSVAGMSAPIYSQSATFTHSYSQAGTYTVKFIVYAGGFCQTCGENLTSAQTSLTVVVGNSTQCTVDSDCPSICATCPGCGCTYYKCVNGQCVPSSITVTSPNGGEYWFTGSNHNITWNSTGFSSSDTVQINLYDSSMNCGAVPAPGCWTTFPLVWNGVKNTGSYTWDTNTYFGDPGPYNPLYLSQRVSNGAVYKIKICKGDVCDYSNNYFSIGNRVVYPY